MTALFLVHAGCSTVANVGHSFSVTAVEATVGETTTNAHAATHARHTRQAFNLHRVPKKTKQINNSINFLTHN